MDIKLSHEEAVVLEELLHRISQRSELYEDIAEQYVLWHMQNQLEKVLAEPHDPAYKQLLAAARKAVQENY